MNIHVSYKLQSKSKSINQSISCLWAVKELIWHEILTQKSFYTPAIKEKKKKKGCNEKEKK